MMAQSAASAAEFSGGAAKSEQTQSESIDSARAKSELRQVFKRSLSVFNRGDGAGRATSQLCFNLETFLKNPSRNASGTWAAFQPFGDECDIRPALARLSSIDWVYPRVEGGDVRFYRTQEFTKNKWGILEPDPARSTPVDLGSLQGLVIPALAFDSKCNRLGHGRGFYDRVLAELKLINPNARKIGVALDIQISAEVFPAESFDVPMDWVVTESRSFERTS